jgi:hypothetical protein
MKRIREAVAVNARTNLMEEIRKFEEEHSQGIGSAVFIPGKAILTLEEITGSRNQVGIH